MQKQTHKMTQVESLYNCLVNVFCTRLQNLLCWREKAWAPEAAIPLVQGNCIHCLALVNLPIL